MRLLPAVLSKALNSLPTERIRPFPLRSVCLGYLRRIPGMQSSHRTTSGHNQQTDLPETTEYACGGLCNILSIQGKKEKSIYKKKEKSVSSFSIKQQTGMHSRRVHSTESLTTQTIFAKLNKHTKNLKVFFLFSNRLHR